MKNSNDSSRPTRPAALWAKNHPKTAQCGVPANETKAQPPGFVSGPGRGTPKAQHTKHSEVKPAKGQAVAKAHGAQAFREVDSLTENTETAFGLAIAAQTILTMLFPNLKAINIDCLADLERHAGAKLQENYWTCDETEFFRKKTRKLFKSITRNFVKNLVTASDEHESRLNIALCLFVAQGVAQSISAEIQQPQPELDWAKVGACAAKLKSKAIEELLALDPTLQAGECESRLQDITKELSSCLLISKTT
jgi:hypothetical protein